MDKRDNNSWSHPIITGLIDKKFIKLVQLFWAEDQKNQWILHGDWLNTRADIVSWMRTTYWRYHNYKFIKQISAGFITPWNVAEFGEATLPDERVASLRLPEKEIVSQPYSVILLKPPHISLLCGTDDDK